MKRKITFIFGTILIIYIAIINMISTAKVAFSVPAVIFGIVFIIYSVVGDKIINCIENNIYYSKLYKTSKVGVITVLILLIGIEFVIIAYPKHNIDNSDYVLVLGAGLSNGIEPGVLLSQRLNAAIDCVNNYNNNGKIVVSGGKGSDEKIAESEAMKKYLIDRGIPEERILVENKSSTTSENFKFSKEIIENDSRKSIGDLNIKIVTTDFHSFRSRILAKKNGYVNTTNYSSTTAWYLIPVCYVREGFAVVKSVLFD